MTDLAPAVRTRLAEEIAAAGGREVSFVAELGMPGTVTAVRPVARGTVGAVLALPGVAARGEMVLHETHQIVRRERDVVADHDHRLDLLAQVLVRNADDSDFDHSGMLRQLILDLDAVDVLAAPDDHVLGAIGDV